MDIRARPRARVQRRGPRLQQSGELPALIERLAAVLPTVADRFEVVLVNDGSRDESWDGICQAARKHAWVRGINLMRNYGQHNALLAGIRAARFAVVGHDGRRPPAPARGDPAPPRGARPGPRSRLRDSRVHRAWAVADRVVAPDEDCGSTGCWGWRSPPAPAPSGPSGRCSARDSPTTRGRRSPSMRCSRGRRRGSSRWRCATSRGATAGRSTAGSSWHGWPST